MTKQSGKEISCKLGGNVSMIMVFYSKIKKAKKEKLYENTYY